LALRNGDAEKWWTPVAAKAGPYNGGGGMNGDAETRIRLATEEDVAVLRELIDASVRGLQAEDYSATQIDHALRTVFGVDSQLIADGTYFVVEARAQSASEGKIPGERTPANQSQKKNPHETFIDDDTGESFVIAGCGGWSRRKKLYGGDAWTEQRFELLDPAVDAAKIRAFFITPRFARMGIGTLILQACEAAAFAEGFRRFEMGATLTGVKLFAARGYVERERITLDIGEGDRLPVVRMEKRV
jgi:GNAT superfamily N-acetyltransferase